MSVLRARRPRTYLPADQRRTQILEIAKDLFAARGYHGCNIAEICSAARIGRGTLYIYFENKRHVLLALLEDVADRVITAVEKRQRIAPLPASHLETETIVRFCERRMRELLEAIFVDEATLRLILREARGLDGVVDRVLGKIDDGVLAAFQRDLEEAQQAGILRAGDPQLLSRFCLGGIEKIILLALQRDEPIDLEKIVKETVELQLFGLLPAARRGGPA